MSLSQKERELASIGASVASGCERCVEVHVRDARKEGASDDEIAASMTRALEVRESAARVMQRHTLNVLGRRLFGAASKEPDAGGEECAATGEPPKRIDALVSIAASHAVNCPGVLEKHAEAALELGVTEREIQSVLRLSKFIKGKADSLCCKWI
jgi:AhpD family alkylhydroperoxidase